MSTLQKRTENFVITTRDLKAFKDACDENTTVELISYDIIKQTATVEYYYEHGLFFLGQMFQLKKNLL